MSDLGSLNTLWTTNFGKVDPSFYFAMIGEHLKDEDVVRALARMLFLFPKYTVVVAWRRVHNDCV
jgi:hypothetical protein